MVAECIWEAFCGALRSQPEDNGASNRRGEPGGNRRRVRWYKANGASQEDSFSRVRSTPPPSFFFPFFLPHFLSFFLLLFLFRQFSTCLFSLLVGLPFTLLRAPVLYSHGYLYSCFSRFTLGEAVFRRFCKKLAPLPPSRPSLLFARAAGVLRFLARCQKLWLSILNIRLA